MLLLLACTPQEGVPLDDTSTPDTGAQDTGAGETGADNNGGDSGGETGETEEPVELPYSGGSCPTLADGRNEGFASGDASREFRVLLPAEPRGAGVIFLWHWLGGSARQVESSLEAETWAEAGFVVVSPEASGDEAYEWDFLSGNAGNDDGLFFDDLLACVHATWQVDLDNLHATGMSAGGLWTTWLATYRADVLASAAPLSGGTSAYRSPARPIPILLTWGGPSDLYQGFSFEDASETFSEGLQEDGHFLAHCVHDGGHTIPREAPAYLLTWFLDHPSFVQPDPYEDGLPGGFPSWCSLP